MKKLIIISVVMAVIVSMAVVEIGISRNVYGKMEDYAARLEDALEGKTEGVKDDANINALADEMNDFWEKWYTPSMMFANHNVVKNFNEKVISLKAYVVVDAAEDAYATSVMLRHLAQEMGDEIMPFAENIL